VRGVFLVDQAKIVDAIAGLQGESRSGKQKQPRGDREHSKGGFHAASGELGMFKG
jgi:hypothetical protein